MIVIKSRRITNCTYFRFPTHVHMYIPTGVAFIHPICSKILVCSLSCHFPSCSVPGLKWNSGIVKRIPLFSKSVDKLQDDLLLCSVSVPKFKIYCSQFECPSA